MLKILAATQLYLQLRWHFGEAHANMRTQTEEEWTDDMNKEFSQLSHKVLFLIFDLSQEIGMFSSPIFNGSSNTQHPRAARRAVFQTYIQS